MPRLSPNHSPTMAPMRAVVVATRRATNRKGSITGRRSFHRICAGRAPNVRRSATDPGSHEASPLTTLTVMGKKDR